jgi:tripartite-type tricarboxylate transporter receptor subunit TctC
MNTSRRALTALCLIGAAPASAQAPAWPTRLVSIVVAFAPGGAADVIARILARRLAEQIGGSVMVENWVGGGGTVSAALSGVSALETDKRS